MTEDMIVEGEVDVEETTEPEKFTKALKGLHTPLDKIFGKHVIFSNGKPYIERGTKCPSLYGSNVPRSAIEFHEAYDKPRVILHSSGITADLSIAALDLRGLHDSKGIEGLTTRFRRAKKLHLRIGLARGWPKFPDRCYMQLNGICTLE